MATGINRVLSMLRGLAGPNEGADQSDRDLLNRFAREHDQASFETLVRRHGTMVLAVCRKVLHDQALVDDVFQAVFLVLARKAGSIAWRDSVGGWLHEVAQRLATKTNSLEHARRRRESEIPSMTESCSRSASDAELVLHEELAQLPEKYRSPLVLCYLEGKTGEQAAGELGIAANALHVRLHRGREFLRDRLNRRGVALTSSALAAILSQQAATASVPLPLTHTTVQIATQVVIGKGLAGRSALVPILVEGALQEMFARKMKRIVVASLVLVGMSVGLGALTIALAASKEPSKSGEAIDIKPATKEDRELTTAGNTRFAVDLYGQLRGSEGNLFLSPYSISTALAMTHAGARGNTEAEMAKTLHFGLPQAKLHSAFAELIKHTNGDGKERNFKLSVANRLFGQTDYGFRPDFLKLTEDLYGAGLQEVDFGQTEAARATINGWVEKKTEEKIKDLIKPGILDGNTRLVLTNAIYFKGDWLAPFNKKATCEQPFHVTKDAKKNVPLMSAKSVFKRRSTDDVEVVELPYKGEDVSMVVFLPKKVDGLRDFEQKLTAEQLTKLLPAESEEIKLELPRFKFTAGFLLKGQLIAMGMREPFTDKADFSGLCSKKLFISEVVHKAFVSVDEDGTEAAAATAVGMSRGMAKPVPTFRADHPFLFVIKDNTTNSILFMGRVVDPTQS